MSPTERVTERVSKRVTKRVTNRVTERAVLRRVQLTLALLVLLLIVVGRSEQFFPITGWPLYESIRLARPDASVNAVYLRVSLADGTVREIPAQKLVEYSRADMVPFTVDAATRREDSPARKAARRHLAHLLALKLGTSAFDSIAVSQRVWTVSLAVVPPVSRERPLMSVPVAHFAVPR